MAEEIGKYYVGGKIHGFELPKPLGRMDISARSRREATQMRHMVPPLREIWRR